MVLVHSEQTSPHAIEMTKQLVFDRIFKYSAQKHTFQHIGSVWPGNKPEHSPSLNT